MHKLRMIAVVCSVLLIGCQSQKKPVLPPPATAFTVERMQADFQKIDPTAQVGLVSAVMPADHLAAVSDIDTAAFHVGQPLIFIDTNKKTIGGGTVIRIVSDLLVVRYDQVSRPLRKGDIAVRVKT